MAGSRGERSYWISGAYFCSGRYSLSGITGNAAEDPQPAGHAGCGQGAGIQDILHRVRAGLSNSDSGRRPLFCPGLVGDPLLPRCAHSESVGSCVGLHGAHRLRSPGHRQSVGLLYAAAHFSGIDESLLPAHLYSADPRAGCHRDPRVRHPTYRQRWCNPRNDADLPIGARSSIHPPGVPGPLPQLRRDRRLPNLVSRPGVRPGSYYPGVPDAAHPTRATAQQALIPGCLSIVCDLRPARVRRRRVHLRRRGGNVLQLLGARSPDLVLLAGQSAVPSSLWLFRVHALRKARGPGHDGK